MLAIALMPIPLAIGTPCPWTDPSWSTSQDRGFQGYCVDSPDPTQPGAVICADNTAGARGRQGYAPFFEAIDDPAFGLRTMTLPFEGGFEMTVKIG